MARRATKAKAKAKDSGQEFLTTLRELGAERGIDEMCEDTWRWQSGHPNGFEG